MTQATAYLSPDQPPRAAWRIAVDHGHVLHVADYGVPDGMPALVLHGGPGSGSSPAHLRYFAANRYRVILADQRGCGLSVPTGEQRANTTADLLADIVRIADDLRLDRPLLVGGSWGATLALLYAAAQPQRIGGLLLRNPFLGRQADLDWFFGGARYLFPEVWAAWAALGAPNRPSAMPAWLAAVYASDDRTQQRAVTAVWQAWECALAGAIRRPLDDTALAALLPRYRLQCHYFSRTCFLAPEGVLGAAEKLARQAMPVHVLQGLADHVCPAAATRHLLARLPAASVAWLPGVGHDPFATTMLAETRRALDAFVDTGRFLP